MENRAVLSEAVKSMLQIKLWGTNAKFPVFVVTHLQNIF